MDILSKAVRYEVALIQLRFQALPLHFVSLVTIAPASLPLVEWKKWCGQSFFVFLLERDMAINMPATTPISSENPMSAAVGAVMVMNNSLASTGCVF